MEALPSQPNRESEWKVRALRREVVFCDESSESGERCLGVGGIWIAASGAPALRQAVGDMCVQRGWRRDTEFKWAKLSGRRIPQPYLDLADLFFRSDARFNCMIVDRQSAGRRSELSQEEIYYRRFHWLLRKRMERECAYQVAIDEKHDRQVEDFDQMRKALNAIGRRDLGLDRDCFREIVGRNSKKDPLIQIADVLLGAACYHFNYCHEAAGASASKCEFAARLAQRTQARPTIGPTWPSERKFNVWLWSPSQHTQHGGRPSG